MMNNTPRRSTPPIKMCARNLVTGWNLVKTWSPAGDQLFTSGSVKTLGLLGPWGILVRLVTHFLKWGRALASCELESELRVAVSPTWSAAENLVSTSPTAADQVFTPGAPKTTGLSGDLNNLVTWSARGGGAQ